MVIGRNAFIKSVSKNAPLSRGAKVIFNYFLMIWVQNGYASAFMITFSMMSSL